MAFSQLGYQYIRPIYPSSDRPGNNGGSGGGGTRNELSPSGTLSSVLSSMYGAPYAAAAAAAQGYGAFLPYAAAELPIFPQLGAQYELKESPGVQHAGFSPHHPAFYPYGQYQFGDPSRPKNATRESTSTLKAWLNEHRKNPYPTKGEKIMLAIITKMTLTQVSTWFANARRRLKKENKMTWAPRSRTDEEEEEELEEEEGNAYGSEHDGEGGKRSGAEAEDEEIDLENVETEAGEGAPSVREGDLGGGCQRLLEGVGGEDEDDEEEGLEEEERAEEAANMLASDGSKATDSEGSDVGFEDFPGGGRERFLLRAVEEEGRPVLLPLLTRRLSPPASPPTAAAPSPALLPPPPPPPPSKPKIWSLAETATSPDTPSRKSPPAAPSSGAPSSLKQLVGGSPPAAPAAHRLVSACPLGKFAAGWANSRPFSAHPPHHHHHHHHHSHHPHALTLLNAPHLLGLSGGNPSSAPNTVTVAAAAALAAFSRPAEQAQSPEAADGTDRSSALEVEKKLIKTAFHPVQRRPQNQLDAAMVLSALSSS